MRKHKRSIAYTKMVCALVFTALILGISTSNKIVHAERKVTKGGAVTENAGWQDYSVWSSTVKSYLFENDDHSYTRVEENADKIVVELYSNSFKYQKTIKVPMELTTFGGFYAGKDGYYFVFGQNNPKQKKTVEVFRVVKYSKNWKRVGECGLYDCNTTVPFDAGSLRFAESGKMLYIRTSHEMYKSSDGYNHQANLTMSVDTQEMKITDSYSKVMNVGYGYVSHSFNQFIKVNDKELLAVDHGDAYPRSIVLIKYDAPAGEELFAGECQNVDLLKFTGKIGANYTGGSVGGFETSDRTYLVVGNNENKKDVRNVFVSVTSQSKISDTNLIYLTNYKNKTASTPQLVKVSNDKFLVLWEVMNKKDNGNLNEVFYVWIDQDGKKLSEIQSVHGRLSDCQPIVANDKVLWYYTQETAPIMCSIPSDGSKPVNNPVEGDTYAIGKLTYRVVKKTQKTKTVAVTQAIDMKATSITVPDCVKINNETYKVTEIDVNAFYYCQKLKKLTIGKNVKKIGLEITSFWCKSLTQVKIKSTVLSKVGDYSFQAMKSGTIKVPKNKLAKYKKLLAGKGQENKVKIIGF